MKLNVENFGPINKAKNIEVSPMTVFVGPSNTGKSYLAVLIYSIMKVFRTRHHRQDLYFKIIENMEEKEINLSNMFKDAHLISTAELDEYFITWATSFSTTWKGGLVRCFGEEGKKMIGNNGKPKGNNNLITISDANKKLVIDLHVPERSRIASDKKRELCQSISNALLKKISLPFAADMREGDDLSAFREFQRFYTNTLHESFSVSLFDETNLSLDTNSFYLPAVRGGIMQSHRTIVGALIERASMAGLSEMSSIPLFNGVLSDFMKQLIDTSEKIPNKRRRVMRNFHRRSTSNSIRKSAKETTEISEALEAEIMEGTINVETSAAHYPDFRYSFDTGSEKYDLPLMSASSMVSELAPVALFLRHYVLAGDLFILEEPEAHLHPAAERDITKILVKLVNAGVFVLITTHSDYILEQLGNYVHAAGIGEPLQGVSLSEEKISAYRFDRSKRTKHKKTNVKLVSFDDEMGFMTEDHSDVSSALYNESVDLFNARERIAEARKTNDA